MDWPRPSAFVGRGKQSVFITAAVIGADKVSCAAGAVCGRIKGNAADLKDLDRIYSKP